MPTEYKRKGVSRAEWSEDELQHAMEAVQQGRMGVREAVRNFGIPYSTLRRRLKRGDSKKTQLGPVSTLGQETEFKLVKHIKKLQKFGFAPTRTIVRSMAFELAEKLNLNHKFNTQKRMAGYPWLESFLRRNKDLTVRKSEGASASRSLAMTKNNVAAYFTLLENTLIENDLMDKPGRIYNVDETGLQLNNRPGHVIAQKGSKNIDAVTSGEKGETVSVIACCNAEGSFTPPTCIFKGKYMKAEFLEGMPPGAKVFMSEKSAYVNNVLFLRWLREQFVPRKSDVKVLLILDGHSSHCSSVETLEYAAENDIILVCLPSHTTQFLQPLDRGVFKSLKAFYYEECNAFMRRNPGRRINRLVFGRLLAAAWEKCATSKNATSSFKATGIASFDPSAIPDYAYLTENPENAQRAIQNENANLPAEENVQNDISIEVLPSTSAGLRPAKTPEKSTPGKMLDEISLVPMTDAVVSARSRGRQLASILTSNENIENKKETREKKKQSEAKKKERRDKKKNKRASVTLKSQRKSRKRQLSSSESEEEEEMVICEDSSDYEDEENICVGCHENYNCTVRSEDWIQCVKCARWLHEGYTKYSNMCDICGKLHYSKKC